MQHTQETMPPAGAPVAAQLNPCDHIRLDKTRMTHVRIRGEIQVGPDNKPLKTPAYSTIEASERTPEDPYFHVRFMQDGLPFDANGDLVADDGKRAPFQAMGPDGKPITYYPLYDTKMRSILEKKMKRILEGIRSKAPAEDDTDEDREMLEAEASTVVNIPDWLMGDMDYAFYAVQAAVKSRYGVSLASAREIVRCLVLDEKIMSAEQVAGKYRGYL